MKLLIIRHAESANNRLAVDLEYDAYMADRSADPPLTELGIEQAMLVSRHLADDVIPEHITGRQPHGSPGYGVTKLYCSPMLRALHTAQPIGDALGIQPEIWMEIHEHGGLFLGNPRNGNGIENAPGLTREEILRAFPGYVLPDEITSQGWWRSGHEDLPGCYARATRVASALRERAAEGHEQGEEEIVAIVSHGTFIDCLLKALFKQIPERNLFYLHYNTAITRIDFRSRDTLLLRYLNRTQHLMPALISE